MQVSAINNQANFQGKVVLSKPFNSVQAAALNVVKDKYDKVLAPEPYNLFIKNNFIDKTISFAVRGTEKRKPAVLTVYDAENVGTKRSKELAEIYNYAASCAIEDYKRAREFSVPVKMLADSFEKSFNKIEMMSTKKDIV